MKPSLHYTLMKTNAAMRSCITNRSLTSLRLVGYPARVLEHLLLFGPSSVQSMALHCEIDPGNINDVLQRMLREKLIERVDEDDQSVVALTAEGRFAADWLKMLLDEADELATCGLSDDESQQLNTLLIKVYQNLRRTSIYPIAET